MVEYNARQQSIYLFIYNLTKISNQDMAKTEESTLYSCLLNVLILSYIIFLLYLVYSYSLSLHFTLACTFAYTNSL